MTTMSGTICVDRRSSLKESQSTLPKHSRRTPALSLTDSKLLKDLYGRVDSSNGPMAPAPEEIPAPVQQLDKQSRDSVVQGIMECLRAQSYRELRSLTVDYSDGVVTLRGEVTTYYYKQIAQESVRRIAGVIKTINLVDVRYAESMSGFRHSSNQRNNADVDA